jgi:hypothetical protein
MDVLLLKAVAATQMRMHMQTQMTRRLEPGNMASTAVPM